VSFEITGIKDVQKILNQVTPRHARNLASTTVQSIAMRVAKDARLRAPKSQDGGTLKKSISAKRRRTFSDQPVSDVVIHKDAFYWRFVEYGTGGGKGSHLADIVMPNAHPFLRPAADEVKADIVKIYTEQFGKQLEKALAREAKKRAKAST